MADFLSAIVDMPERVMSSWPRSMQEYASRVQAKQQPQFGLLAGTGYEAYDFTDNQNWSAIVGVNVVYFVLVAISCAYMKNRKEPFDLKPIIRVYNAVCVALAAYVVYGTVMYKMAKPGPFVCNSPDVGTEAGQAYTFVIWVYYAQKYFEMLDTFFFIFRQSWRQLTFLHLYHHSSITFVTAAFCNLDVNGDLYLAALCNSFIHVLMYTHYFLSSFGIKTWYRPFLTQLQLVQFAVCWIQPVLGYFSGAACGYADWLQVMMTIYQTTMMVLFADFYRKSYSAASAKKKAAAAGKKK
jgi:elongation of very long chain fatty acids protein 4